MNKKQHVTIHDIARKLNVSASTVSRALHNHPRISEATRNSVKKVAAKLNYQPNVMASALRRGSSKTVGVIVPRINRNFFSNVIGGMEELLASSGYHLMICQTQEKLENEVAAVRTLINARVDAVLLSISMETAHHEHLNSLTERGIPLFHFDRVPPDTGNGSVVVDDHLGAYLSVKHLLEQGYRKILHVSGKDHINIYRSRKEGYLQAMQEAGIDVPRSWILQEPLVQDGGEKAFRTGMQMEKKADAFFCSGDFVALGILQAAKREGVSVPGDLGVSGFANEPFTAFLEPSLTTVDQHGETMGRKVAEMFLRCENQEGNRGTCEQVVLQPELIIRNSSLKQTNR
ncbi:MAG: LacI family DNA-binding transcriptional regulator [Bacteroidota bacterium]|nr:LacI family DNA-binding transcriptional regulator [Bacteroidota bacterium]